MDNDEQMFFVNSFSFCFALQMLAIKNLIKLKNKYRYRYAIYVKNYILKLEKQYFGFFSYTKVCFVGEYIRHIWKKIIPVNKLIPKYIIQKIENKKKRIV